MGQNSGGLFSAYFLEQGAALDADWRAISQARLTEARDAISRMLADFETRHAPNEASTERDLIDPLLALLGWDAFETQVTASSKGRADVPDYLLYGDSHAKGHATGLPQAKRYALGASILEAKAWGVDLDRAGNAIGDGAPANQLLRYLANVDVQSSGAIRFGMLTNGRVWRLYDGKARSRLEGFVEIDLREAVGLVVPTTKVEADHADRVLQLFLWLFGRDAFEADALDRTRIVRAIAESRSFEARVTKALAEIVFTQVFPDLANGLAKADPQCPATPTPAYLAEVREAALIWLYRLLFVLYAEDRGLLPTAKRREGLRRMREQIAEAIDRNEPLSSFSEFDGDLRRLWRRIDVGDEGIGLPPYNGGLFKRERSALLERSELPDAVFAPLLDALSRERIEDSPRFINYRDLDVQHLGSVYERLLEYDLIQGEGRIATRPQTFARKTSGSYYTPEELVMLVIRRTVGPLLDERRQAFAHALDEPARRNQDAGYRMGWLKQFDPATAFLTLRICDPAMGSGHFLVSLVDYMADQVMLETENSAAIVDFGEYRSPLLDRLAAIRDRIRQQAGQHRWLIDEAQLTDRQLVRRIILKRVIHGVDKNPMAVELAKLSLWLHTFTVGAPLSFLDHHLRCGDSLFGEWVRPALDRFARVGLFKSQAVKTAELAIGSMQAIEEHTDADIAEVHDSAAKYEEVKANTAELGKLLSALQGFRWIGASTETALKQARALRREADRLAFSDPAAARLKSEQAARLNRRGMALEELLEAKHGDPIAALDMCYGRIGDPDPAKAQIAKALAVAADANFLHWQIAFPGVWHDWENGLHGGFDAVIGNPPWDRLKLQEVEWFAARKPEIAYATRASDRKRMVAALKDAGDPLAMDHERAGEFAGMAARMAGLIPDKGGQYPLLGGGDVNLYSLFVERASRLVKPDGLVGLLVPSGISGDLGASAFFRSVSTTGRLGSLLDYANRPVQGGGLFFEDVDSRFKFSAMVFGGGQRRFGAAECGFFLTSTADARLSEQTFPLTPEAFAAVNPNSGTSPVFRTPRDAALVTSTYGRVPVLADHRIPPEQRPWRVRYLRMFDMTNDSHLFHTAAELQADGWYPVASGRWRKGADEAVPLYEGKMVQAFDHRAASVVVNLENLHRPAQQESTSLTEHANPDWSPSPQFYVSATEVSHLTNASWHLAFKSITAPTNVRTMIAGLLPFSGVGNSMGMILANRADRISLYANLNSFALDFCCRQKVQGQNLNWFIVEQLPVIPPAAYKRRFGALNAREIVAREVLRLTYTAHDMADFARDMGWVEESPSREGDGLKVVKPPFIWDDHDRRQRRARLDALYFHLYGIGRDDADYILSTFPIVRRQDEAAFGRYLTRDLILHQMSALEAGDTDAVIAL